MNMNLVELIARYSDEDKARKYIESVRWPEGPQCPRCANEKVAEITTRNQYACSKCQYRFSLTTGTIFHDSHLPLSKWLIAIYLMMESKKGISAKQLERTLGVTYKTAWYLSHRIRTAMRDAFPFPLKGRVEIDETWIGGKVKGMGQGYKGNKALVIGAHQRNGKVILKVIKARTKEVLHAFVRENVHDDAVSIYTDDFPSYDGIGTADRPHETVNHSEGEYVRGDVHTNSIENVWGLFKRQIIGAHHHMSVKHLEKYLDELEWRFNNRENPWLFRDTIQKLLSSGNVEYKELIA